MFFDNKNTQTNFVCNFIFQVLFTSCPAPCRLILSLLQGKQNLWWGTDGHWTKCVSSNLSWHKVHFKTCAGAGAVTPSELLSLPGAPKLPAPASVDVTVVEETCLEPEDLLPLEEPAEKVNKNSEEIKKSYITYRLNWDCAVIPWKRILERRWLVDYLQ